MNTSRYAPKTPAQSLQESRAEKLNKDKANATRLLGRLRWKAELLMESYYKALRVVQTAETQSDQSAHVCDHNIPKQTLRDTNTVKKHVEAMFKVDFFEFFTLLERYITNCLSIFGITVSGAAPQNNVNALRYLTNPDLHKTRPIASHAFHANLLEALDDEKCPLHSSLGIQEVRIELGLAKDFRNAWKDADARVISSQWHSDNGKTEKNITLSDSQLMHMLHMIVAGCEQAHEVVQSHTISQSTNHGLNSRDFEPQMYDQATSSTEEVPFEYMDDAMDLD